MKARKLAPDGAYGQPVQGYRGDGKERFLRDARALLREVGKHLVSHGLTEMDVNINPAGPAVAGDAYGVYWHPDDPSRRAYVNVSDSALGWGRNDHLIVMARVQHYRHPAKVGAGATRSRRESATNRRGKGSEWRTADLESNQWLSANFDSRELADRVWKIFNPATACPDAKRVEGLPKGMTAFTSEGEHAIPSPIVHNDGEAVAWAHGMRATEQAFAADNEQAVTIAQASVPAPLSLFNEIEARQEQEIGAL